MSLEGKVAIVTGASSGIGRATAVLFSKMGAKLVLVGRRLDPLKDTLSELHGGRGLVVQADVSKSQDAKRIVDETLREFGKLDILVNNAGTEAPFKSFADLSEEEWDYVMNINLKGVFLCSKFAFPAMKKNGRGTITNVASNWGLIAAPNASVYCASKAGVILLTKAMAMDVADYGITVNCICPGDTNAGMELRDLARFSEERRAPIIPKLIPVEQISHAILYLVSDNATMSTGTALIVDNGSSSGESQRLLTKK
ncbi:MAG TPA: SDR family oxidoreductase [Candidatus Acidoferrum sp.]|nr:SDR family oxidoreductase [Candidatus Acidoferrum sp.]